MMTKLHMTISLNIVDDYRTFLNVKDLKPNYVNIFSFSSSSHIYSYLALLS